MRRYARRGSKGIALVDTSGEVPQYIVNVFTKSHFTCELGQMIVKTIPVIKHLDKDAMHLIEGLNVFGLTSAALLESHFGMEFYYFRKCFSERKFVGNIDCAPAGGFNRAFYRCKAWHKSLTFRNSVETGNYTILRNLKSLGS